MRDTSSLPREAIRRNVGSKNDRLERGSVGRSRASVVDTSSGETDDEQSDDSPKHDVSFSEELLEEDEEVSSINNKDEQPQLPNTSWSCEHCTFVNDAGTRVCSVCCKTPTAKVNLVRTPSSVSQGKKSMQSGVSAKKPPVGTKSKGVDKSNKTLQSPSSDDYSANSARDYSETESMQNKLEQININNLEVEKKPEAKPKGRTIRKISFWPGTKFTASFYRNK